MTMAIILVKIAENLLEKKWSFPQNGVYQSEKGCDEHLRDFLKIQDLKNAKNRRKNTTVCNFEVNLSNCSRNHFV